MSFPKAPYKSAFNSTPPSMAGGKMKNWMALKQPELHLECVNRRLVRRDDDMKDKATAAAMISAFDANLYRDIPKHGLQIADPVLLDVLTRLWKAAGRNKSELIEVASRWSIEPKDTMQDIIASVITKIKVDLEKVEQSENAASSLGGGTVEVDQPDEEDDELDYDQPMRTPSTTSKQAESSHDIKMTGTDNSPPVTGMSGLFGKFVDGPGVSPRTSESSLLPANVTSTKFWEVASEGIASVAPGSAANAPEAPKITPSRTDTAKFGPSKSSFEEEIPSTLAARETTAQGSSSGPDNRLRDAATGPLDAEGKYNLVRRVLLQRKPSQGESTSKAPGICPPPLPDHHHVSESLYDGVLHYAQYLNYATEGISFLLTDPVSKIPDVLKLIDDTQVQMDSITRAVKEDKVRRQAVMDEYNLARDTCMRAKRVEEEKKTALEEANLALDERISQWETLCRDFTSLMRSKANQQ